VCLSLSRLLDLSSCGPRPRLQLPYPACSMNKTSSVPPHNKYHQSCTKRVLPVCHQQIDPFPEHFNQTGSASQLPPATTQRTGNLIRRNLEKYQSDRFCLAAPHTHSLHTIFPPPHHLQSANRTHCVSTLSDIIEKLLHICDQPEVNHNNSSRKIYAQVTYQLRGKRFKEEKQAGHTSRHTSQRSASQKHRSTNAQIDRCRDIPASNTIHNTYLHIRIAPSVRIVASDRSHVAHRFIIEDSKKQKHKQQKTKTRQDSWVVFDRVSSCHNDADLFAKQPLNYSG
jgi:hypothetical protein